MPWSVATGFLGGNVVVDSMPPNVLRIGRPKISGLTLTADDLTVINSFRA